MSAREPCTYALRERGKGLIAAWSTWAVAFRNLGFAFMARSANWQGKGSARENARGASLHRHYPYRSEGFLSPHGRSFSHRRRTTRLQKQMVRRTPNAMLTLIELCDNSSLQKNLAARAAVMNVEQARLNM